MLLAWLTCERMQRRHTGRRTQRLSRFVIGATLLLGAAATPGAAPNHETVPARIAATPEQPLRQYRAYRRMHARNDHFDQEAWLEAWTEFDERGFRYTIVSERGSDYIRSKVLKAVLRREQELVADGDCGRSELTPDNYEFEDMRQGDGEQYVTLKPKRKDVLLVDGRMVLSEDGSELLRVEGRLSKNPSFWTSLVNVIRHYARLDGVRVPIATESTAKVKFAGLSHLDVHYEYETINNRPVSLAARRTQPPTSVR
jgi:hypothetical protein